MKGWLFFLLFGSLFGKTICLNMIVKNESQVIERCLSSVKEIIDYWVIVDTGSTDGTQALIKSCMQGIPGELHERPWVDFAHNRNEALSLAKNKGDFLLFMDADEYLVFPNGKKKPPLDKEAYLFPYQNSHQSYTYYRIAMIDNHLPWQWKGEIHESIESLLSRPKTHEYYREIVNVTQNDGARSQDPQKALRDAQVLEKMVEKDPDNARSVFYLAQSYLNAASYPLALKNFEKRSRMGGCEQEIFWSLYQAAVIKEMLNADPEEIVDAYKKAHQFRPSRAEPLFRLAAFYEKKGNYPMEYTTAKQGLCIPLSTDFMFVENWVYDFGLKLALAHSADLLGKHLEAAEAYLDILMKETIPKELRENMRKKLSYYFSRFLNERGQN